MSVCVFVVWLVRELVTTGVRLMCGCMMRGSWWGMISPSQQTHFETPRGNAVTQDYTVVSKVYTGNYVYSSCTWLSLINYLGSWTDATIHTHTYLQFSTGACGTPGYVAVHDEHEKNATFTLVSENRRKKKLHKERQVDISQPSWNSHSYMFKCVCRM